MKAYRRIMMRKCHMSGLKRFTDLIDSVNERSRYEHKLWLEELDIEPNSKEAFKYTRARTSYGVESDCDAGRNSRRLRKSSKLVAFSPFLFFVASTWLFTELFFLDQMQLP